MILALVAGISPILTAPAAATVTSVMHHPPRLPESTPLLLNGVNTFTGTLRCADIRYNNFLVTLQVRAYADLDELYPFPLYEAHASIPVDRSDSQGDTHFAVDWDATDLLGSQARVVKARWIYYDCALGRGQSDWGYIQSPTVDIVPVDQLAPSGTAPSVSLKVRTYDVYDERYSPTVTETDFADSTIFDAAPTCLFDDYGDTHTAAALAIRDASIEYSIECSGAALSTANLWREDAIWYEDGVLETYNPDFQPISQELFASLRDRDGNQGIGVGSSVPFGDGLLLYNFTGDDFDWGESITFQYSILGDTGVSFQNCTLEDGWTMRSSRETAFAMSSGRISNFGDTAALVRLYEVDEGYLCDTLIAIDSAQNPIIGAPRDFAFDSTDSSVLLSEDGSRIYKFTLPDLTVEGGDGPLTIEAVAETTMPQGRELSRVFMQASGEVFGVEVTNSHVVLHRLNLLDLSNSPVLESVTLSHLISNWETSSEKFISELKVNESFLALQITNSIDTSSSIIGIDLSDLSATANFENLTDEWCPVARDLGYQFSAWGEYSGCQPQLVDISPAGAISLATPDLQILRSISASPGVIITSPEPDFSYEIGLNEDNFYTNRQSFNISNDGTTMWIRNTDQTYHGAPIPAAQYRVVIQSPNISVPSSPQVTPSSPQPNYPPTSPPVAVKPPELGLKANYAPGEDLIIPLPMEELFGVLINDAPVDLQNSGSNTVVSLKGILPGVYDLTLRANAGTFVFLGALKIEAHLDRTPTRSETIEIRKGHSFKKALSVFSKMRLDFRPTLLTCAYSSNRVNARTVCNSLGRELKLATRLVKVTEKLVAADSIAVRLRKN